MKISGIDRQLITNDEEETKGVIDCIKGKITSYQRAKVRAKAEGIKTQDYSFFDENFTYPVEIATYKIVSGEKYYHTAKDLSQWWTAMQDFCFWIKMSILWWQCIGRNTSSISARSITISTGCRCLK